MPQIRVLLPRSLRSYWDAPGEVALDAETVALALQALGAAHPGLASRILDEQGALRPYVHVFVNEQAVESAALAEARLRAGDVVRVLPSVAGG